MTPMELSKAIQQQIEVYKEQQNRLEDIINCLNSSKEALELQPQHQIEIAIKDTGNPADWKWVNGKEAANAFVALETKIKKNTIKLFNPNPPKDKLKIKGGMKGAITRSIAKVDETFKLKMLKDILINSGVGTPSSFNTCFHQMMRDGELKGSIKAVRGKRGMYRKVVAK